MKKKSPFSPATASSFAFPRNAPKFAAACKKAIKICLSCMIQFSVEQRPLRVHNFPMQSERSSSWSIGFNFAGVPTTIHPSAWLVLLILGGAFRSDGVLPALVFTVFGMLCLLVHEYGHAFVCRWLGGGRSVVQIASMGGVTSSEFPPPTRAGHILMVLAGPGASLLLGLLGGVVFGILIGDVCAGTLFSLLSPIPGALEATPWLEQNVLQPVQEAVFTGDFSRYQILSFLTLFEICVWWTLINLLPVFPLDGGQALLLTTRNEKLTAYTGVTICVLLIVVCLIHLLFFSLLLSAYFLYLNYQFLRTRRQ